MGRVKELLMNQSEYSMSYLLIVDIIKNADEVIYTLRDLLNDKTYRITEYNDNNRVSYWLKKILDENGIKYRDPTYNLIIKYHLQELYFHAWINDDPQTTNDIIIIKEDIVKTFFMYESLEIDKIKSDTLKSINQHIGCINKNIDDLINR